MGLARLRAFADNISAGLVLRWHSWREAPSRAPRPSGWSGSSDSSFGFTFAGFFLVIGLWPLTRGVPVKAWALVVSAIFLVVSLVRPRLLALLNRLWLRVGLVMHCVVNPLVMGVMFYGVITPVGLAMRWAGRDLLRRRFDAEAQTYWVERRPPGPASETMINQF